MNFVIRMLRSKALTMAMVFVFAVLFSLEDASSAFATGKGARLTAACTLPTLEAIVREVAGDHVDAFALSAGDQDPHFVAATPVLMKRVREADLLFEMGMMLEPWVDEVVNGSGNPRLFRGAPGRIVVSAGIPKLEVPSVISRAEGDIHPEGNPHLWLDPVRAKLLAANVAKALKAAAPKHAVDFDARLKTLGDRLDRALFGEELLSLIGSAKLSRLALDGRLMEFLEKSELRGSKLIDHAGGWIKAALPLRAQNVLEFHRVWAYFAHTFGFKIVGSVEEKPGIPPGPRHIQDTIGLAKTAGVKLIFVDNFYDPSLPKRIASESGARVLELPNQVRGEPNIHTYFELIDHLVSMMTASSAPAR